MEQLEIVYLLEESQIKKGLWEVFKRTKLVKTVIFAAVFILLSADFFWVGNLFVGVVSLAAGIGVVLVPLYQIHRAAAYSARAQLRYKILLLEDGCEIDVRSPYSEEGHPYQIGAGDVHRVYGTADFFLLCITREKIIPIPKNVLSPEEKEAAVCWMRKIFGEKYREKK